MTTVMTAIRKTKSGKNLNTTCKSSPISASLAQLHSIHLNFSSIPPHQIPSTLPLASHQPHPHPSLPISPPTPSHVHFSLLHLRLKASTKSALPHPHPLPHTPPHPLTRSPNHTTTTAVSPPPKRPRQHPNQDFKDMKKTKSNTFNSVPLNPPLSFALGSCNISSTPPSFAVDHLHY